MNTMNPLGFTSNTILDWLGIGGLLIVLGFGTFAWALSKQANWTESNIMTIVLQNVTVIFVIIATTLLTLTGQVPGQEAVTLFSGIAGYVLGRASAKTPRAQLRIPRQATHRHPTTTHKDH